MCVGGLRRQFDSRLVCPHAVYWEGAVRVSRDGASVGRGYLELTGYANALRIGKQ
jgi:predicted secreted hydrolase